MAGFAAAFALALALQEPSTEGLPYPIVGTGQTACYDEAREIAAPRPGAPFYGQDAQHAGREPSCRDNGDGTVTDLVTGLMWQKSPGPKVSWDDAGSGASAFAAGGHADWRLPDAKELQSLVDSTRAPAATGSPTVDPVFETTRLADGEYPYFWTSTTHPDGPPELRCSRAVYIAFGRATGHMEMPRGSGRFRLLDVQGAGAQRSDPKRGDPADLPRGHGPQGDVVRIHNFVRLVRDVR